MAGAVVRANEPAKTKKKRKFHYERPL